MQQREREKSDGPHGRGVAPVPGVLLLSGLGRWRTREIFALICPPPLLLLSSKPQEQRGAQSFSVLAPLLLSLLCFQPLYNSPRRLRPAGVPGIPHFFPSVPYLVRRAAANRAWVGWMLSTSSTFTRLYGRGNNGITSQCSVCHILPSAVVSRLWN